MTAERHHFVPQGYLRGFVIDGIPNQNSVLVYDKQPNRAPRKKSVRSIAWAPAYYAQEYPDGSTDTETIETVLATTIDNQIPQIIKRINIQDHAVDMTVEDKSALAFFVGLSMTRVPSFRDGINKMYTKVAQRGLSQQISIDPKLKELSETLELNISAKPWVSLRPMIEVAQSIAAAALTKNWQFFVPPSDISLVTSDNPVIFSGPFAQSHSNYIGPAHPKAELVINLGKDLALVCTPQKGYPDMQMFELSPSETRKFNRGVVRAARQRIFADFYSETFNLFVKKYVGEEQRIVV